MTTDTIAIPDQIRADASLSMLVHGMSKTGKSTFTSTAPVPALVLDAEGSWKFITERGFNSGIPLRTRLWDPMSGPPPRYDGTWDVCRAVVQDWPTMSRVYDWLRTEPHDFLALTLDSISEIQRRCKKNIRSDGQLQQQDWGALLDQMGELLRNFRDLTDNPRNNLRVAVFVAETRKHEGTFGPYVQGQITAQLPYMFDLIGYHFVQVIPDEHGASTQSMRRLLVGPPQTEFVVGERVQGRLGMVVDHPNITDMINRVFPYTPAAAKTTE
jgi:hypothetical protein